MRDLLLLETDHTTVEHAGGIHLPGYLIVQPRAACERLADLDPEARADLADCLAWAEALLHDVLAPRRVYVARFGEADARIHFHVVPRTAEVERDYVAATNDEPPYSGARIVDWIWSRYCNDRQAAPDVDAFVVRARRRLHASS
ncbi:MAG: hypothetical protein AAF957_17305 [Planctomycetota bacterium]